MQHSYPFTYSKVGTYTHYHKNQVVKTNNKRVFGINRKVELTAKRISNAEYEKSDLVSKCRTIEDIDNRTTAST